MPTRSPPLPSPEYRHPLQRFQNLMPRRLRRLLLVASRYDSFLLGEDGRLSALILSEFLELDLGTNPWLTRVSTGEGALAAVSSQPFDMVVMTFHVRDMSVSVERLEKAGVELLAECPYRLQGDAYLTLVRDPDGNFVELVGPSSKEL